MKKIIFILFTVISICSSCSKNENSETPFEKLSSGINGEYLLNNVSIIMTTDNQIGILIENNKSDNTSNRCFILCSENELNSDFLSGLNFQAEIVYFTEGLILRQVGSSIIYYLGIDNYVSTFWKNKLFEDYNIDINKSQLGYSLGSYNREIKIPSDLKIENIYSLFPGTSETDLLKGPKCASGGAGSSECATNDLWGGCSVSCADGYYACCQTDNNVCTCIKIKDPPARPTN